MRRAIVRGLTILQLLLLLACHHVPNSTSAPPESDSPAPSASPSGMTVDSLLNLLRSHRGQPDEIYLWAIDQLVYQVYSDLPGFAEKRPELFLTTRIPFTTSLIRGRLALYDMKTMEVWLYPGAGIGVRRIGELAPHRFLYMRGFVPMAYDASSEEAIQLFDPVEVGGFALVCFADVYSNVYCLGASSLQDALDDRGRLFVLKSTRGALVPQYVNRQLKARYTAPPSPAVTATPSASPSPSLLASPSPSPSASPSAAPTSTFWDFLPETAFFPWDPQPKPRNLVLVNTLAERHGLIQTFKVTLRGDLLVFATRDGGLYLYYPYVPAVEEIRTNRDFGQGRAAFPTLESLTGRLIVWEDFELKQLFMLDRLTGEIEAIPSEPFLEGEPLSNIVALIPSFIGLDPNHLFVSVIRQGGRFRIFRYDLWTGQVQGLALLNEFLGQQPVFAPIATDDENVGGGGGGGIDGGF